MDSKRNKKNDYGTASLDLDKKMPPRSKKTMIDKTSFSFGQD